MNTIRISIEQTCIGMTSAENIFNTSGLLLVPKEAKINQTHLFRLKLYQIFSLLIYTPEDISVYQNSPLFLETTNSLEDNKPFQLFQEHYKELLSEFKFMLSIVSEDNHNIYDKLFTFCTRINEFVSAEKDIFYLIYHVKTNIDPIFSHSLNVGIFSCILANWLQYPQNKVAELTLSGLIHDLGKIEIDQSILDKPGELTMEEFDVIKTHSLNSYKKLEKSKLPYSIKMAVLQHHEKLDGSGYPFGFHKDQIHDFAKIIAICDIYDAMTSDRSYHNRIPPFQAIDIFWKETFNVLDSNYLSVFIENIAFLYIGKKVQLSNGKTGKIVFINRKAPAQPLVQVGGRIHNLEFEPNLQIVEIL